MSSERTPSASDLRARRDVDGADNARGRIRMSSVLSALTYTLDITEGQPEGHAVRNALIGMRVAEELELDEERKSALFYALLLKDLGCSSNAAKLQYLFGSDDQPAKRDLKTRDWTRPLEALRYTLANVATGGSLLEKVRHFLRVASQETSVSRELIETRCERGADIARMLGLPEETADAIHALDEHWDGGGHPDGRSGEEIPLLGRILCLAQTVEVFAHEYDVPAAYRMAADRRDSWFDPELVDALESIQEDAEFWNDVQGGDALDRLEGFEPTERILVATEERLDNVSRAFARVVDAKSPWTFRHSERVAQLATAIAGEVEVPEEERGELRRAALLHDIGKLGVSSRILEKDGSLTDAEYAEIQRHPDYSRRILERVGPFARIADLAGGHHERLDGSGYTRGLKGSDLPLTARALSVADVYEALTAERPYRDAHSPEKALEILRSDADSKLCPECVEALCVLVEREGPEPWEDAPPLPSEERAGRHAARR